MLANCLLTQCLQIVGIDQAAQADLETTIADVYATALISHSQAVS
jgi:hypothetical protein